jgi:dTMP kinase
MTPRFITFEGGEGVGKSTQIRLLAQALAAAGIDVCVTREPGGSIGAEAIRNMVITGAADAWEPTTEALLFMAARHDHVETLIKPKLAEGTWVLCDRFYDSTYVYQGLAKRVDTDWLDQLYALLFGAFAPEFTVLLDMDPAVGLTRAEARGNARESRFERLGLQYHQKIREGFLARANAEPNRMYRIDASGSMETIHRAVIEAVNKRFDLSLTSVD